MAEPDAVLNELDAEIRRLNDAAEQVNADLRKAQEMRSWWAERHPVIVTFGQAEEANRLLPVEVINGPRSLRELILQVLEASEAPLRVPEIRDRALQLGWQTTSKNKGTMIRNYLAPLIQEGRVARLGFDPSTYRLVKVDVTSTQPGWQGEREP